MPTPPPALYFPLPGLRLCYVEGGTFRMGDEIGDLPDRCRPVHEVKVSTFYLGQHPVPQALWEAVMGENPSGFKGENRPVEKVSWFDTQGFIKKLNAMEAVRGYLRQQGLPDATFRLPTEAEWEYAARGGIYSQGYLYAGSDKLKQVGWYDKNSGNKTHEVGLLLPNELGLCDMSGNVWEWCEDWFDEKFYEKCQAQGVVENPVNREEGSNRILRGGGYFNVPLGCRPAYRVGFTSGDLIDVGFRLCLSLQFTL
jgi:formylglycine-generating enzyme